MLEFNKMAYISPIEPGLDLTFQYESIAPLGNNQPVKINAGTLWDFLNQHAEFQIFKFLVEMAQLTEIFNEIQAKITAFIPLDTHLLKKYNYNMFKNMEKHQALKMINYNTLPRKLKMKELTSSSSMKLDTRIRGDVLYTQSSSPVDLKLVGNYGYSSKILKGDIIVNNAIVHITDTFAFPEMI